MQKQYIIVTVLFLAILFSAAGLAQTTHTLPNGIQITVPDRQNALPGQFITYTFFLRNPTPSSINIRLKVWTDNKWPLLAPEENLELPAQGELFLPITVMAPTTVHGATEERLTLSLTLDGQTQHFHVLTHISTVHKVSLEGPNQGQAAPENDAEYPITIYNQGSSTEEIRLFANSESGWAVRIEPESVQIQPGQKISARLTHRVPKHAQEGTIDSVTLTATYSGRRGEFTIKTRVTDRDTPSVTDLKLPIRSSLLWDMVSPESGDDAYLRWAYRMNMSQGDHSLDFFMDGLYNTGFSSSPDTIFLTIDSPDNYLRLGRFNPFWTGVLPIPTQNALLRWDTDRNRTNLQLIIGTERDEERFSDDFRWLGLSAKWPDTPWTFRVLLPSSDIEEVQQMAEVNYTQTFGNENSSWYLRSRLGLGWNHDDAKRIGDLILHGSGSRWRFRCEYGMNDKFFTGYDQQRFHLSNLYRWNPSTAFETGYFWWETNAWTDPNYHTTTHHGLWTRFNFQNYYWLYLGVDHEEGRNDSYLEPKIGLRYARQKEKDLYQFNLIRRYRDYDYSEDNHFWTVESRYRRVYSPQHYWDIQADYNYTAALPELDDSKLRFRLGYSTPLTNTWSMLTSVGTIYNSGDEVSSNIVFRWELAHRSKTENQWRLAVSYNDEYYATDRWFISAFYQGVFTHFFTPPWGSVHGLVYEDVNQNGRYDAQDIPVNAHLILNGRDKVKTDVSGRASFSVLRPGTHRITLELNDSPYYALNDEFDVIISRGKQEHLEIPVRRRPFLRCNLFHDINGDGQWDPNEPVLGGIKVTLMHDGSELGSSISATDGSIYFNNLLPGKYKLRVDQTTLPSDILPFADEKEITVGFEDFTLIYLGFASLEKPIDITFDQVENDDIFFME